MLFSLLKRTVIAKPRALLRRHVELPLILFVVRTYNLYKEKSETGKRNVRELLLRGIVIAFVTAALVWLAILMYLAFYYIYLPTFRYERPAFLKFRSCEGRVYKDRKSICSFPSAQIKFNDGQEGPLMLGQPYKIELELEMPESPINTQLGMFMVCADFYGNSPTLLANSCRSTMLHYRGYLLDVIYKLVFSPFYLFGSFEEKQTIHVELFTNYLQPIKGGPIEYIFIEIQSTKIEIYSAKIIINAHFTGLRFLMYNWPIISAMIGISANLFFIAIVCLISWFQLINSDEYLQYRKELEQKKIPIDIDSDPDSSDLISGEELSLIEQDGDELILHQRRKSVKDDDIEEITHQS